MVLKLLLISRIILRIIDEKKLYDINNIIDGTRGTYWTRNVYLYSSVPKVTTVLEFDFGISKDVNYVIIEGATEEEFKIESLKGIAADGHEIELLNNTISISGRTRIDFERCFVKSVRATFANYSYRRAEYYVPYDSPLHDALNPINAFKRQAAPRLVERRPGRLHRARARRDEPPRLGRRPLSHGQPLPLQGAALPRDRRRRPADGDAPDVRDGRPHQADALLVRLGPFGDHRPLRRAPPDGVRRQVAPLRGPDRARLAPPDGGGLHGEHRRLPLLFPAHPRRLPRPVEAAVPHGEPGAARLLDEEGQRQGDAEVDGVVDAQHQGGRHGD